MKPSFRRALTLFMAVTLVATGLLAAPRPVQAAGMIIVNTTADEYNANGVGGTGCSLREAIVAANTDLPFGGCPAGSGADTIILSAKVYELNRLNTTNNGDDNNLLGDLDIYTDMTITGVNKESTIVQGLYDQENHILFNDRVFHIFKPAARTTLVKVTLAKMTIQYGIVQGSYNWGGGILNYGGDLTLYGVTLANNQTLLSGLGGGVANVNARTASFNVSSRLTVDNSYFYNNDTHNGYGGGVYSEGTMSISDSLFESNTVGTGTGGGVETRAMQVYNDNATITNTTIALNISNGGGAGIKVSGRLTLKNATVFKNYGYGIQIDKGSSLTPSNSIIAGNTGSVNCAVVSGVAWTLNQGGYNLIGPNTNPGSGVTQCGINSGTDKLNTDPKLVMDVNDRPFFNLGFTGVYTLADDSPAIDAIDPVSAPPPGDTLRCPYIDQLLHGRPGKHDGTNKEYCDIGAFEKDGVWNEIYLPFGRR